MTKLTKRIIIVAACVVILAVSIIGFYAYKIAEQLASGIIENCIETIPRLAKENPDAILNDLNTIAKAIREYKELEKRSPNELTELIPKYLPKMPESSQQIKYSLVNGGEFILVESKEQKPGEGKIKFKFRVTSREQLQGHGY